MKVGVVEDPRFGGANMQAVTTIGLDIAKSVFQVHGIDAEGQVIIRRQLRRRYVLAFFENWRRAWSGSRPALRRIIGRANCRL
jgi:transposase